MSSFNQAGFEQTLHQCEAEEIHKIGQIQPHGALLVLAADSRRTVLQASSNLGDFITLPADGACGNPLAGLIGVAEAERIEQLIQRTLDQDLSITSAVSITSRQENRDLQAHIFASNSLFVLELIYVGDVHQEKQLIARLLPLQRALLNLNAETDTYRYFDRLALLTRELTEFDRIMVYRFDTNWEGEVIAESRVDTADSYLGLRFPASDIPAQARLLYTSNLVRQIADINAKPIPVLPALNPVTGQPLDMTHATLRNLSPVHVEYLRNMGVQASMSISLLQNGRLWGLIACHHMTPKQVSKALQETTVYLSQAVTSKLTLIEGHEERNLALEASHIIGELLKNITGSTSTDDISPRLLPDLMNLLGSTGIIMAVEGKHYIHGEVPEANNIRDLFIWLSNRATTELFSCEQLEKHFPPASAYSDIASGLLATPLSNGMRYCVVWLRKEKLRTVHWAGKPGKIFHKDMAWMRLSPRKSFASWTETWRGCSDAWSHSEIETAKTIALTLTQGLAHKNALEHEQAERRRTNEKLCQAAQFLAIFEHSPIAVRIVNIATSRIVFANERHAWIINSVPDKVIGSNPKQYYANQRDYSDLLEQLGAGGPITDKLVELRVGSDGSETKWVLASYLQLEFQGEPSILAWFYDITERKHAESVLLEARKNLENRVIERTEQLRQLAVQATLAEERERHAIARDLHDDLGQILHVARIKFDDLARIISGDIPPQVAELNALISDASHLVRSLTSQLSPPILRDLGLASALRWLSDELEHNYGLIVDTRIEELPVALSQVESVILYRAARELLINVAKHAESDTASIELFCHDSCLLLAVEDDGIGIDNPDLLFTSYKGFGLSSIRERIAFLGGTFTLSSKQEGGVRAVLKMPLASNTDKINEGR